MPPWRCGAAKRWQSWSAERRWYERQRQRYRETRHPAFCPDRYAEQRQDRAVQCAHRQPPEGRQLSGRHRRAQDRHAADAVGAQRQPDRPAGDLFAARAQPRRGGHPRRGPRPPRQRGDAGPPGVRRRFHQPAARPAAGDRVEADRAPAAARAQHDRHRPPARHRDRPRTALRRARGAGDHGGRRPPRRHRRSAAQARHPGRPAGAASRRRRQSPRANGASRASANCAPPSARPTASSAHPCRCRQSPTR